MDAMTILLRFIFGVVLAGSLAWRVGLPAIGSIILVVCVGLIAAVWGDKFFTGFMSLVRYLK